MEKNLEQLYQVLQKLLGLHRQLLDTVRMEKEALVSADLSGIQEATYAKEGLIESIRNQETERMKATSFLAIAWKKALRDLTLPEVIIQVQGTDQKRAEQLRSVANTLHLMIQRISEQNKDNQRLVERSLEHVQNMKKNVLGESVPKSNTYTPQGQRSNGQAGARLISKEA